MRYIVSALVVGMLGGPAFGAELPLVSKSPKLVFSPWFRTCLLEPDGTQNCFMSKDARFSSGFSALVVALHEQEGRSRTLRVTLPLGVQIRDGARLGVDGFHIATAPFVICTQHGCTADVALEPAVFVRLRSGRRLSISALKLDGSPIRHAVSLTGFVRAYDRAPRDIRIREMNQRELQQLLERRIRNDRLRPEIFERTR